MPKSKWDEIGDRVFGEGWRERVKAKEAKEEFMRGLEVKKLVAQDDKKGVRSTWGK